MEQQMTLFECSERITGQMIDAEELLMRVEPLKTVAKLPPAVEYGKYTMVVPYVELRAILRDMAGIDG